MKIYVQFHPGQKLLEWSQAKININAKEDTNLKLLKKHVDDVKVRNS